MQQITLHQGTGIATQAIQLICQHLRFVIRRAIVHHEPRTLGVQHAASGRAHAFSATGDQDYFFVCLHALEAKAI